MSDIQLDALIRKYQHLASMRGVSAANPVNFTLASAADNDLVLTVSYMEPTFAELPYNVLWLDCNPGSATFGQILRRTSHLTDGQHRCAWVKVLTYVDLLAVEQFYRKVVEDISDFGLDVGEVSIPPATVTTIGLVKLDAPEADALVVGDNDVRMSDDRYPLPHNHPDFARTKLRLNDTDYVQIDGSPAPVTDSVLMIVGRDSLLPNKFLGEWRTLTADVVEWTTPRLLALRVSLPGQASFIQDGSSVQMAVQAEYEDRVDPAPTGVEWSIQNNPYNVTIDPVSGTVTSPDLQQDVTLTVTARKQDPVYLTWVTDTYDLRIKNVFGVVTLTSIEIKGATDIQANRSASYTLTGHYSDGSVAALVPSSFSSGTLTALTVSGLTATARKLPVDTQVVLTATYVLDGNTFTDTHDVTVKAFVPVLLDIAGSSTITALTSEGYLFNVSYSNGDVAQVNPTLFSANSPKLTISGKTVAAATVPYDTSAVLSATYTENGTTVNATKPVTIKYVAPILKPVSLAINGLASINEGTTTTYTVDVTYDDGSTKTITPTAFTSNHASLVISGLSATAAQVTATTAVTLSATYTENGTTASTTKAVSVVDVVTLSALTISGVSSVVEGGTASYTFTAAYSDGTTKTVTPSSFTSGNALLVVSGQSVTAGQVTADTNVTLSASFTESGKTVTATKVVAVTNVAPTVVSLNIVGSATVDELKTSAYTATYTMSDGSTQTATGLTWSVVQGNTYATINSATGLLTALDISASQSVMIRAVNANNVSATKTVQIIYIPSVVPVSIAISGATTVAESATTQYLADVTFSDGTARQVTALEYVAWSITSGSAYASVSAAGLVTSVAVTGDKAATLSLTATVSGVTLTATLNLTIKDTPITVVGCIIEGAASPAEGTSSQYTPKISLSDGTKVAPTSVTSWAITNGATKASTTQTGLVTYGLVAANTAATISVTCVYNGTTYTGTLPVTIINSSNAVLIAALVGATSINEGATAVYTMSLGMEDGTTQSVTTIGLTVTSGGAYATASGATLTAGLVSADQVVSLTGSCTYGGATYTASLPSVTIKDVPVVLSSVAISGPASMVESTSQQYVATATFSDGTQTVVTNTATWTITANGGLTSLTMTKGLVAAPAVTADTNVTISISYTSGLVTKTASFTLKVTNTVVAGYGPRYGVVSKVTSLAGYNDAFMQALTTTLTGGAEDIINVTAGSSTSANNKFGYVAYPASLGYAYVRQKDSPTGSYGFAGSWDGALELGDFNFAGAAEVTIGGVRYYIYRNDWPFENNQYYFSFTYGSSNTLSGIA